MLSQKMIVKSVLEDWVKLVHQSYKEERVYTLVDEALTILLDLSESLREMRQ